jgi:hypothetical protein
VTTRNDYEVIVTTAGMHLLLGCRREWFPKAYAWPTTVLVDNFYSSGFESAPDDGKRRLPRFARARFQLMNGDNSYACGRSEFLLAPR